MKVSSSFFRRPLPSPPSFAFSSPEGRSLFLSAMRSGNMECFFSLAENFRTQDEPAYCGLSTLVMVLNAMRVDPGRAWKGPWRFFHESMLDCCEPLEVIRDHGITMGRFSCLARCNGADTELRYAGEREEGEFRAAVRAATAQADVERAGVLVCSYDRRPLGQTGSGHFSPVGGYEPAQDMVLVMDVARFKYPPHWVPLPVLFAAMRNEDPATRKSRGWIVLRPGLVDPLLFTLKRSSHFEWPGLAEWWAGFKGEIHATIQEGPRVGAFGHARGAAYCNTDRAMERLVEELPAKLLSNVLSTFGREFGAGALEKVRSSVDALIEAIEATATHSVLCQRSGISNEPLNERSTPVDLRHLTTLVLLASLDDEVVREHCRDGASEVNCKLAPLIRDISNAAPLLREEVTSTRRMLDTLDDMVKGKSCRLRGPGTCASVCEETSNGATEASS